MSGSFKNLQPKRDLWDDRGRLDSESSEEDVDMKDLNKKLKNIKIPKLLLDKLHHVVNNKDNYIDADILFGYYNMSVKDIIKIKDEVSVIINNYLRTVYKDVSCDLSKYNYIYIAVPLDVNNYLIKDTSLFKDKKNIGMSLYDIKSFISDVLRCKDSNKAVWITVIIEYMVWDIVDNKLSLLGKHKSSHVNSLFIDFKNKLVRLFEPDTRNTVSSKYMNDLIHNEFIPELQGLTKTKFFFISSTDSSNISPQGKSTLNRVKCEGGYCDFWNYWFIEQVLRYNRYNYNPNNIINEFRYCIGLDSRAYTHYIRRYFIFWSLIYEFIDSVGLSDSPEHLKSLYLKLHKIFIENDMIMLKVKSFDVKSGLIDSFCRIFKS